MRPQQFYVTRKMISARQAARCLYQRHPRRHIAVSIPPVYDGSFDRELSLIFISFAWLVLPPIPATIPQAQHRIRNTSKRLLAKWSVSITTCCSWLHGRRQGCGFSDINPKHSTAAMPTRLAQRGKENLRFQLVFTVFCLDTRTRRPVL